MSNKKVIGILLFIIMGLLTTQVNASDSITIYSGRSENLIGPVFEKFSEQTEVQVNARYGDTAELAGTILEEGKNSPADIFFAQDAGALGALAAENRLQAIPEEYLSQVDSRLRDRSGLWLGISGRARVVAYNINYVDQDELPDSIWGFTDPKWNGRLGWSPTNGSFQAFVTAFRVIEGDYKAEQWLRGILANQPRVYRNNTTTVDAVGRGEVHIGFVNHYYLFRFMAEQGEGFPVRHLYTTNDAGSMINISGIGVLDVASDTYINTFIEFLLSSEIQQYFIDQNNEYPVVEGIEIDNPLIMNLQDINTPDLDLSNLEDLEGTLELLFKVGAL